MHSTHVYIRSFTNPLHTPSTHSPHTPSLSTHSLSTHSPYIHHSPHTYSPHTPHTLRTSTALHALPLHTSPPLPLFTHPPPPPHTHTPLSYTEEKYIVLESLMYPGQHVAVLPDGTVKNPKNSHTGLHARFVPIVMETVSLQTSSHVTYLDCRLKSSGFHPTRFFQCQNVLYPPLLLDDWPLG